MNQHNYHAHLQLVSRKTGSPGHEKQQETEAHAILPTQDQSSRALSSVTGSTEVTNIHKTVLINTNRYITLGVMAELHTEQLGPVEVRP